MSDLSTDSLQTTGFTEKTMEHLLLDAGALYKNLGLPTQGLIGATSGGNEFQVKQKISAIKIDGIKAANVKGMERVDSVETTLKCNFIEATPEVIADALIATIDTRSDGNYYIIKGKSVIDESDYIDNIAWVGTVSGSKKPVIIFLYNAASLDGLQLKTEDSKDITLPVTFTAHADPSKSQELPYAIYYPKEEITLVSEVVNSGKIILTMSGEVSSTIPPDGFTATVAGTADVITAASKGVSNVNTIELTLTTAPTAGQNVTIAYTKPTDESKQVKSAIGKALDTFTATNVTNS